MADIIKNCIQKDDLAQDSAIDEESIEYNPIDELLEKYPNITSLIFTSEKTLIFLKKYLRGNSKRLKKRVVSIKNKEGTIKINNKIYPIKILYSPSPYCLRSLGKDGAKKRIEQYKKIFGHDS